MPSIYTAEATATGGREGTAKSSDGNLDVKLTVPKEMGGAGGTGTNPEQLFAAGYAACFIGAMQFIARRDKIALPPDVSITARVGIGPDGSGGFGLEVDLAVSVPGMERQSAEALVEAAHKTCPYSNATRNNIPVRLEVA